jgi:PX domain
VKLVEILLASCARTDLLNSNDKLPLDYETLPEIRDSILTHIMKTQLKSKPVAIVLSYLKEDSFSEFFFELRSAKIMNSADEIVIVKRSLHDFVFFRSMLVKEHPEAFMYVCINFRYDIRDLLNFKRSGSLVSNRVITKMRKKLEAFLFKLMDSKKFQNHELVWEFLQAQEFQHASVQVRVSMKTALLEEMRADSISHEIHNLTSTLESWRTVLADFEHEIGFQRRCGTLARKIFASQTLCSKDLLSVGYQFSFIMGIEQWYSSGFRRLVETIHSNQGEIVNEFLSQLQEQDYLLVGGLDSLLYVINVSEEHQALQQHLDLLQVEMDSKSTLAKSNPTPEVLKEFDKTFESFSKVVHNSEALGSKLNFTLASLEQDLRALKVQHTRKLQDLVDNYVDKSVACGEEVISILSFVENINKNLRCR